jgi:hypothetical protein
MTGAEFLAPTGGDARDHYRRRRRCRQSSRLWHTGWHLFPNTALAVPLAYPSFLLSLSLLSAYPDSHFGL